MSFGLTRYSSITGGAYIWPFSPDFNQAVGVFWAHKRELLVLTLKACLVLCNHNSTETVLKFAYNHRYLLALDE